MGRGGNTVPLARARARVCVCVCVSVGVCVCVCGWVGVIGRIETVSASCLLLLFLLRMPITCDRCQFSKFRNEGLSQSISSASN